MTDITRINVLLVEDDRKLASLTAEYLRQHEVVVGLAYDGESGLREALAGGYDAVLLDIMLPGLDGIAVCQRIREHSDVPIIMLTARGEEADRVLGLELGADDYMPKPFSPRELLARIRVQVRRRRGNVARNGRTIKVAGLLLEPSAGRATRDGNDLDLTSYEFMLLCALAENAGRVLSRDRLMDLAKGNAEESFDRSIDVHISRLRKKLGDDSRRPSLIKTVRGIGYMLASESNER